MLGTMLAAGETIVIHCENDGCRHQGEADLRRLIDRLGADFHLVSGRQALLAALRCPACGRHPKSLLRIPLSGPHTRA